MAYAVPASKASIKQNRFEFSLPGSKKMHSLPKIGFMSFANIERWDNLIGAGKAEDAPAVFEYLVSLGAPADIREHLNGDQARELIKAWSAESGITLGESPASTD